MVVALKIHKRYDGRNNLIRKHTMPDQNDDESTKPVDKRLQALAAVENEQSSTDDGSEAKPVETKSYFSSITEEKDQKLKKNKVVIILLVVGLVVTLALLALGVYLYTQLSGENDDRRTQINSLERSSKSIEELKKDNQELKKENETLSENQEESSTSSEKMEKDLADAKKKAAEQQATIDELTTKVQTLEKNMTTNISGTQSQSPTSGSSSSSTTTR